MLIPRSQGREVSQPNLQQHTPITGLQEMGRSIGGAMNAHEEKLREQEAQQKQIALYHDKINEQEAKVKLDDVMTSEMSEQVTLVKNDVSNGVYNAQKGGETLKKWSDERYKQLEETVPLHAREQFKSYWDESINRQSTDLLPLQLRADAQKSAQLVDRAFDIATRYEDKAGEEYLEIYLANAQMPEARKSEIRQTYKTTRNIMDIDGRISSAVENEDLDSLRGLLTDIDANKYGYIDGPTNQQKRNQVLSRIDSIETKQRAEANKRNSEAGKFLNEYKANVLTGRAQDSEYESNIGSLVKGTEYEQEFQFYKAQSVNIQKFANLPTSEMLKRINQQKANMKNTASADAVTEEKLLGVFEGLYKDKLETAKNNPNQIVRETGLQVHSLSGAELKSNPSSWVSKAVQNGTSQLALKDPNVKVRPISAEDLPEAQKAFSELGINQKLEFIGQAINGSKHTPNGTSIWQATLKQLGGDDRTYLLAGLAKSKNRKIGTQPLADAIIQGHTLVKSGGFLLPSDLDSTFRARYGNLSNYGTFDDDLKKFKYAYAAVASKNGINHTDKKDISDTTSINKAFELATGGAYVQSAGWFSSFKNENNSQIKSWKVPKPYGMTDDVFEDYLENGYESLSKQSGYSVSELQGFRLVPKIANNSKFVMYNLVDERGRKITGKSGKEQFIIFNGVER